MKKAKKFSRKLTSPIWEYFAISEEDESKAKCKLCTTEISRGGDKVANFTTTNLKKHLEDRHKEKFAEFEKKIEEIDEEKKSGSNVDNPLLITDFYHSEKTIDFSHPMAKKITTAIAFMISADCQPISIVENDGFRYLLNLLEPRYVLPTRQTFSEKIILSLYSNIKNHLKKTIKESNAYCSFTTDI